MANLKLGPLPDDKPVRLTITVSAQLAELLREYADAVGSGAGGRSVTIERIIPVMLERFIRTDRVFMRSRRGGERKANASEDAGAGEPG